VTGAAAALERLGGSGGSVGRGFGRVQFGGRSMRCWGPTHPSGVGIWGQSRKWNALQPIEAIGRRCRAAGSGVSHLDAVQVRWATNPIQVETMPLTCSVHRPTSFKANRGIGCACSCRPDLELLPCWAGGGQEAGRRAGTEPVVLAAGWLEAPWRLHVIRRTAGQ